MDFKGYEEIQALLMNKLKSAIPQHLSLAEVLSDVLDLSNDSAYRRIRCESALSIDEVRKICRHFKISFDSLMANETGAASFNYSPVRCRADLLRYLIGIRDDMLRILHCENKSISYASFDVPIFHIFKNPEYFQFKVFYWLSSIAKDPDYNGKKYSVKDLDMEILGISQELTDIYAQIPSIELWTDSTVNSLVKQVEFCWMAGQFVAKDDIFILIEKVRNSMEMVQHEVDMNVKYMLNGLPGDQKPNFQLYQCDIEIGNNTILVNMGGNMITYITYHTFNRMYTSNQAYCNQTSDWLNNLTRQSNLISGVAQKNRFLFFNEIYSRLNSLRDKVEKG
ncbi:MAG: helix-turn-helix domain-containing protein [Bacteroidota bacterium]